MRTDAVVPDNHRKLCSEVGIETLICTSAHTLIAMALQGHIVIPTTHDDAEDVIDTVTSRISAVFGGYSRYDGSGGWVGDDGRIEEDHARIVVNVPEDNRYDKESFMGYLRVEALCVKDELGEDAVLIEVHEMDMELV